MLRKRGPPDILCTSPGASSQTSLAEQGTPSSGPQDSPAPRLALPLWLHHKRQVVGEPGLSVTSRVVAPGSRQGCGCPLGSQAHPKVGSPCQLKGAAPEELLDVASVLFHVVNPVVVLLQRVLTFMAQTLLLRGKMRSPTQLAVRLKLTPGALSLRLLCQMEK